MAAETNAGTAWINGMNGPIGVCAALGKKKITHNPLTEGSVGS